MFAIKFKMLNNNILPFRKFTFFQLILNQSLQIVSLDHSGVLFGVRKVNTLFRHLGEGKSI